LFHNSNGFGSCFIHILYTGVLKFKKNNSGAKRLSEVRLFLGLKHTKQGIKFREYMKSIDVIHNTV